MFKEVLMGKRLDFSEEDIVQSLNTDVLNTILNCYTENPKLIDNPVREFNFFLDFVNVSCLPDLQKDPNIYAKAPTTLLTLEDVVEISLLSLLYVETSLSKSLQKRHLYLDSKLVPNRSVLGAIILHVLSRPSLANMPIKLQKKGMLTLTYTPPQNSQLGECEVIIMGPYDFNDPSYKGTTFTECIVIVPYMYEKLLDFYTYTTIAMYYDQGVRGYIKNSPVRFITFSEPNFIPTRGDKLLSF